MTPNFFYYRVPKTPEEMTPDELVREIQAGKEAHYHAEATGAGISTKEHVRRQNCELELVSRPKGIDRWNEEFGKPLAPTMVYVVAWHYEGGSGFDWYFAAEQADVAYAKEVEKTQQLKEEGWSAYRFDFQTDTTQAQAITAAIDADLDELCVNASRKAENILPQFGRVLSEIHMRTKVDVQGDIPTISEALGKAAEADGLGVAEAVSLVIQDCLGHPWVDEELQAHMAESLCGLFTKHVQAVNLPEDEDEEDDDDAETQRRDEKHGLYGGLVDDSN